MPGLKKKDDPNFPFMLDYAIKRITKAEDPPKPDAVKIEINQKFGVGLLKAASVISSACDEIIVNLLSEGSSPSDVHRTIEMLFGYTRRAANMHIVNARQIMARRLGVDDIRGMQGWIGSMILAAIRHPKATPGDKIRGCGELAKIFGLSKINVGVKINGPGAEDPMAKIIKIVEGEIQPVVDENYINAYFKALPAPSAANGSANGAAGTNGHEPPEAAGDDPGEPEGA